MCNRISQCRSFYDCFAWNFEETILNTYLHPLLGGLWSRWEQMAASCCHLWWRCLSGNLWVMHARLWLHHFFLSQSWFGQNWHNGYLQSLVMEFSLQSHGYVCSNIITNVRMNGCWGRYDAKLWGIGDYNVTGGFGDWCWFSFLCGQLCCL